MNYSEIKDRIFAISGCRSSKELSLVMDRGESEVGNWFGRDKNRRVPLEFVVDFCVKYGQSIDYVLFGKKIEHEQKNNVIHIQKENDSSALSRSIVEWVESQGEDAKHYDSCVFVAVKESFPKFTEWQKKREGHGGVTILPGEKSANE